MYTVLDIIKPASKYSCIIVSSFCLNICGGACGNILLLLNISICLVLNTKEVVRSVSAAIQNRIHGSVLKICQLLSFSLLTFSAIVQMQDAGYPCHPFQNLIGFCLEVPSRTPLSNSEIEIFPLIFRTFLLCEVNFTMTYVMAGVHLASPS